jgi:hypothetical protein
MRLVSSRLRRRSSTRPIQLLTRPCASTGGGARRLMRIARKFSRHTSGSAVSRTSKAASSATRWQSSRTSVSGLRANSAKNGRPKSRSSAWFSGDQLGKSEAVPASVSPSASIHGAPSASSASTRYQTDSTQASSIQRATREVLPEPGSPTTQVIALRRWLSPNAARSASRRTWLATRGTPSLYERGASAVSFGLSGRGI